MTRTSVAGGEVEKEKRSEEDLTKVVLRVPCVQMYHANQCVRFHVGRRGRRGR
jgi:hypothetical protein